MIGLRDFEFLSALARHQHFARAAKECGVTQPAFSMRIRRMEEQLGSALVKRGNRFQGFTAEGEMLVRHARKVIDDLKTIEQEFHAAKGEVSGSLSIGTIPTANVYAARMVNMLQARHPGIRAKLLTATSLAIQQGLEDGQFDIGFTYGEEVAGAMFRIDPLYLETYQLLIPEALAPRQSGTITWEEAAAFPLSLLVSDMQNRRIIDQAFAESGLAPNVVFESSGFISLIALVSAGESATIIPSDLVGNLGQPKNTVILDLVEPIVEKQISLISRNRELDLPAVNAIRAICLPSS